MESLFETAVMVSIVLAILFFAYHIATYVIHRKAHSIAAADKIRNSPNRQQSVTVDHLPGGAPVTTVPIVAVSAETVAPAIVVATPPASIVPQFPSPTDPHNKDQGSATFTTQLRQPENLFHKHESVETTLPGPGGETVPMITAQNEGVMGEGITAYDSAGVAPFSAL